MKRLNIILLGTSLISLVLSGCFVPGTNEGTLTIRLPGNPSSSSGRTVVTPAEIATLNYEIILDGPGGRRTERFTGTSVTVRVSPGRYRVVIRAYGNRSFHGNTYSNFPQIMLRGWGIKMVDVKAGANNTNITMTTALEVTDYAQFNQAIANAGLQEEIIIIKGTVSVPFDYGINNKIITFIAETPATLDMTSGAFQTIGSSILTLGKEGMGGTLTINGGSIFNEPLIRTFSGNSSKIIMNNGVILQNRQNTTGGDPGGGVYVGSNGIFIMNGGTIRGNYGGGGGGVHVMGNFIMTGGIISNNITVGQGGGVFVDGGHFTMNGGIITGNFTDNGLIIGNNRIGGGVRVDTGTFTLDLPATKANISGNIAMAPSQVSIQMGAIINGTAVTVDPSLTSGW